MADRGDWWWTIDAWWGFVVPNSCRTKVVQVNCCRGYVEVFAAHAPPHAGRPPRASPCFRVCEAQVPTPLRFAPVVQPLRVSACNLSGRLVGRNSSPREHVEDIPSFCTGCVWA